jgi:tetratricopeptide (TPR) repeat protein
VPLRAALAAAAVLALAAPLAAAPRRPAPARESRAEKVARAHFERAEKAFNLGHFDEALAGYQDAYQALPLPAFVFNIAQCHRNLGNGEQAVFFYQRYLSLQPDAPNRPVVEELIADQTRLLDARKAAEAAAEPAPPPRADDERPAASELAARPAPQAEARARPLDTTPVPAAPRSSRRWWIFGALGAALLGGVAFLALRGHASMPTGQLGTIDTR